MNRSLRTLAIVAILALPQVARAQGGAIFIDAGQRKDEYGDNTRAKGSSLGFGYQFVLGGSTSEQVGFIMPLSVDYRYAEVDGTFVSDMNGDMDLMMRIGPVSFGGGIAGRLPWGSREYSWNCTGYENCPASGYKDAEADDAISIGFSLAGKVSFGPQGRLFVQGKQTTFSTTLDSRGEGESCNEFGCVDTFAPELESGREQRVSAGIVFPNKGSARILRAQMVKQKWVYDHLQTNLQGGLDRESTVFTLGVVWTM